MTNEPTCSSPSTPSWPRSRGRSTQRQLSTINLIASENFASPYATCLEGSVWANKNGEGYPGKRFVAGCELADRLETIAIERAKALFGCEHANVQSMSATIGNVAILNALLEPGDTILSMELTHGGHLSHGAKFHYSGKAFKAVHYGVERATERIDMEQVASLAREHRPAMIICGCSSYPRTIDYAAFKEIAASVGAILLVDLAHNVGLVAAKVIPSPFPHADVVSTSTHKTFRGPRGGGLILCRREFAAKIDREVFPGLQGAPKLDLIAARAVLFKECMTPEFRRYGAASDCQRESAGGRAAARRGCDLSRAVRIRTLCWSMSRAWSLRESRRKACWSPSGSSPTATAFPSMHSRPISRAAFASAAPA